MQINDKEILNIPNRVFVVKTIIIISILFLYAIIPDSKDQTVFLFQNLLEVAGIIFLFILTLIMLIFNNSILSLRKIFYNILDILFETVSLVFVCNFILYQFGETILTYFKSYPETQFLLVIILALFFYSVSKNLKKLFYQGENSNNSLIKNTRKNPLILEQVRSSKSKTQTDISIISAHETGHLLLNYLYGKFPENFRAEIFENDIDNISGMVSHIPNENTMVQKEYDLWRMHVLLSGQLSESYLLGINSTGSTSDFGTWQVLATGYLQNQFEGFYYVDFKSDLEMQHNLRMLERLKEKQTENILNFMKENSLVMHELYNQLAQKKVLLAQDIEVYFDKINFLECMPYPNGRDFIKSN